MPTRAPSAPVNGRTRDRQDGFTLIELTIAVAIVAMTVAAGIGLSLSSRSLAVATAATEFDQLLDAARTIARESGGATIVFAPDAYGDGTQARVLTNGTGGTLTPTTLPVVTTRASIAEALALGSPPFAFVVHASGLLAGRPGFRVGDATTGSETPCPASGSFHFTIATAGASTDRFVPCRLDLASTGPPAFTTWPPATLAPLPTPCASCTIATVPTMPPTTPTCPPNSTPTAGGCVPNAAPQYHVTASAASAAITLGATDTVAAQSTLTNPLTAPPGTPASIPVNAQVVSGPCATSPQGSQPSGTAFVLTATAPGTCTIAAQADTSAVPGATADSANVVVTVNAGPTPTPAPTATPQGCDLVQNGKCYHTIVPQTNQVFTKYVVPSVLCVGETCSYADTVSAIELYPQVSIAATVAPTDSAHQLLIEIQKLTSVEYGCLPYSQISGVPGDQPISWSQFVDGSPLGAPAGYSEPARYAAHNHVTATSGILSAYYPWTFGTTTAQMIASLSSGDVGSVEFFTYFDSNAASAAAWNADFPGCDSSGDPDNSENHYGIVAVGMTFQIYQAAP